MIDLSFIGFVWPKCPLPRIPDHCARRLPTPPDPGAGIVELSFIGFVWPKCMLDR
jgi:hypothetical protein